MPLKILGIRTLGIPVSSLLKLVHFWYKDTSLIGTHSTHLQVPTAYMSEMKTLNSLDCSSVVTLNTFLYHFHGTYPVASGLCIMLPITLIF